MTISDFQAKKGKSPLSMVTCYDFPSAQIVSGTSIDSVLVGDSLAMTMHGHQTTLPASMPLMVLHTQAVARGLTGKLLISDLPFLSYRMDLKTSVQNAGRLMRAGAHAVKLEGAKGNLELIRHLVDSGVPVMGHIGLTPQSVHQLGGFKVQGKNAKEYDRLLKEAHQLEEAGCFSLVLECVPSGLSAHITRELKIPTIGIGAGSETDGQVLVWHDLLGLNPRFKPKFVRTYMNAAELIQNSLNEFDSDVKSRQFPSSQESYT